MQDPGQTWLELPAACTHTLFTHSQPCRVHTLRKDGLLAYTSLPDMKAASTVLVQEILKEQDLRRSVASGPGEHVTLVMDLSAAQPTMAPEEGMTDSRVQYRCSWLSIASRSCRGRVMLESGLSAEHSTAAFRSDRRSHGTQDACTSKCCQVPHRKCSHHMQAPDTCIDSTGVGTCHAIHLCHSC